MRRLLLALPASAAAAALSGCGAVGHQSISASPLPPAQAKQTFVSTCGGCHTLKAAGTSGVTGPNLDDAWACANYQGFKRSTFRDVVRGQIDYAAPPMPQQLVKGKTADAVADYVASVAGNGVNCTKSTMKQTAPTTLTPGPGG